MKSRIRQALKERNLNLTRLATELGITLQSVSETMGKDGEAPLNYIAATVRLTGYRYEWIVTGIGPKTDSELVVDPLTRAGITERDVYKLIADLYEKVERLEHPMEAGSQEQASVLSEKEVEGYPDPADHDAKAAEPAADVSKKQAKKHRGAS